MAYKVLTSQQLHKLHDMYLNGSSIADIAKELNCTTRTVYYHINKNKSKASKALNKAHHYKNSKNYDIYEFFK